jgi:hypothetical protein
VSPAAPFLDASLPNHTKMFELVHVVTSIDDFASLPLPCVNKYRGMYSYSV